MAISAINQNYSARNNKKQVSFSSYECLTPKLLTKEALRDAVKVEGYYPLVDGLSENLERIKNQLTKNERIHLTVKVEKGNDKKEPRYWAYLMPENSLLKKLNANGYKKEEFIHRSYTQLTGNSDVFVANVTKKAQDIERRLNRALAIPKTKIDR